MAEFVLIRLQQIAWKLELSWGSVSFHWAVAFVGRVVLYAERDEDSADKKDDLSRGCLDEKDDGGNSARMKLWLPRGRSRDARRNTFVRYGSLAEKCPSAHNCCRCSTVVKLYILSFHQLVVPLLHKSHHFISLYMKIPLQWRTPALHIAQLDGRPEPLFPMLELLAMSNSKPQDTQPVHVKKLQVDGGGSLLLSAVQVTCASDSMSLARRPTS